MRVGGLARRSGLLLKRCGEFSILITDNRGAGCSGDDHHGGGCDHEVDWWRVIIVTTMICVDLETFSLSSLLQLPSPLRSTTIIIMIDFHGFMVFHGFWLVSIVFQGGFMVFHGFWLVNIVFQGGFMVFPRFG